MDKINSATLDYNERDPKTIHDPTDFQVSWEEVFAEPDPGVHSFKGVWKAGYLTFSYVRLWTYRILSALGVIQACLCGFKYGCTSCYMIWCCWPLLKLLQIQLMPVRRVLEMYLETFVGPMISAMSMIFWNLRVTMARDDGGKTQTV